MTRSSRLVQPERWAVLVTGSRRWSDELKIQERLETYNEMTQEMIEFAGAAPLLIHGNCKTGADQIAAAFATDEAWHVLTMDAQWDRDGKPAGRRRNEGMLRVLLTLEEYGYQIAVEAFPMRDSTGTPDMVSRARTAGVRRINVTACAE